MKQLVAGVDSMELHGDSLGRSTYDYISRAAGLGAAPAIDYVALNSIGRDAPLPPEAPTPVIQGADGTVQEMSDSERTARRRAEEVFATQRKAAINKAVAEYKRREPKHRQPLRRPAAGQKGGHRSAGQEPHEQHGHGPGVAEV